MPDGGMGRGRSRTHSHVPGNASAGTTLLHDVVRSCRSRGKERFLADSTGVDLGGERFLISVLALRRVLQRTLRAEDRCVGVLMPPSVGGALVNVALAFDGRVAVGLNYSLTPRIMNLCLAGAETRIVITSHAFQERFPIVLDAELIFVEDLRDAVTTKDKLIAAATAKLPVGFLLKAIGRDRVPISEPMTVVFTSGSAGEPKGVVLSYGNIQASVMSAGDAILLSHSDILLGILPFFHVFGYVFSLWAPLVLNVGIAYHPNPLEADGVGRTCRRNGATILLTTPTFLRSYQRRVSPADFASLEVIVAGGEHMRSDLIDDVERTFGVRPVLGYGATEVSSLVCANIPPERVVPGSGMIWHEGTVGRPLPGIRVKVLDTETGEEVPHGASGMLWVAGGGVMQGYLGRAEETARVVKDGWYSTGDIVAIEDDGAVRIVGRLSRFAKIGGEMVPMDAVEEELCRIMVLAAFGEEEGQPLAVVAMPDTLHGERLVVIHKAMTTTPVDLRRGVIAAGFPPLYAPSTTDFYEVETLPTTGTGKLDLVGVNRLAAELVAARHDAR